MVEVFRKAFSTGSETGLFSWSLLSEADNAMVSCHLTPESKRSERDFLLRLGYGGHSTCGLEATSHWPWNLGAMLGLAACSILVAV